jgi:hypothetical protein
MGQVVVQKLNKREASELNLAIRYFTIIAAISDVPLTKRQIELLAFTALKGTISSGGAIQDFVETFNSSKGSLENMKHTLVKLGLIVKIDNKYKVVPTLCLDFSKSLVLQVNLDIQNGQSEDGENKTS